MKTYIRNTINGYYIDFPEEIDTEYWSGKIGETFEDFQDGKWILLSNEQLEFKFEHPNATIQQVIEMHIDDVVEPERTLELAKAEKIAELMEYDSSDAVNSFDVIVDEDTTISAWLTPAERSNYRSSIDAAKVLNKEKISLYISDVAIELNSHRAELILAQIQSYADLCYIATKHHSEQINALKSIEDVDSYTFDMGYPPKLRFDVR